MGKVFWKIASIVVALPMIAGFAPIPHSAKSQCAGTSTSGLASFWMQESSSVVDV